MKQSFNIEIAALPIVIGTLAKTTDGRILGAIGSVNYQLPEIFCLRKKSVKKIM